MVTYNLVYEVHYYKRMVNMFPLAEHFIKSAVPVGFWYPAFKNFQIFLILETKPQS